MGNGKIISALVLELMKIKMEDVNMKGSGKIIYNMARDTKSGKKQVSIEGII